MTEFTIFKNKIYFLQAKFSLKAWDGWILKNDTSKKVHLFEYIKETETDWISKDKTKMQLTKNKFFLPFVSLNLYKIEPLKTPI